jgi:TRAP-type transport system small permease protein
VTGGVRGPRLARPLHRLDALIEALAALLMAALTILVFLGVFYRYVLVAPLAWVEEVARLCLVWVSFLGAYLAMRRAQHITLELVRARLPPATRRVVDLAGGAVLIAFLLVLVGHGVRYAHAFWNTPSPYLGFPAGLTYVALPCGALLLIGSVLSSLRVRAGQRADATTPAR